MKPRFKLKASQKLGSSSIPMMTQQPQVTIIEQKGSADFYPPENHVMKLSLCYWKGPLPKLIDPDPLSSSPKSRKPKTSGFSSLPNPNPYVSSQFPLLFSQKAVDVTSHTAGRANGTASNLAMKVVKCHWLEIGEKWREDQLRVKGQGC